MHIVSALVAAAAFVAVDAVVPEHKIASLPGYADDISFDQYAGHLALPSNGQKMFYWLVESEESPSTAPLVLWLNGGPGCSSLGGFFTELGPFVVNSDLSVQRNPYAWNRKANMVFLESPSGVGFSTPELPLGNYTDDFTTARTYEFLEQFFAAYPSYHGRDFYITGESYAGVYIPFLVHELVKAPLPYIALKGFAIGNPFTDEVIDSNAQMDYDYTHGLISIESYSTLQNACKHTVLAQCLYYDKCDDACGRALDVANTEASTSFLDPYYLNGDKCLLRNDQLSALQYRYVRPMHRGVIGPCQASFAAAYLSQASVQTAIHASSANVSAWTQCNNRVSSAYTRTFSALPKYPTILRAGLKALIYSGDADSVVNFIGTQRWLTNGGLNLSVEAKWKAWFGPDKQLAGYTEGYTNMTFTTIKGAGHMVPAVRPLHSLYLFECFLFGNDVCKSFTYPKDELEYLTGAVPDFFDQASGSLWLLLGAAGIVAIAVGAVAWHRRTARKKSAYVELKATGQPTQYGSDAAP